MACQSKGRRKGSRNRGYFYCRNRGWFTKSAGRFIPLADENGERLRDPHLPEPVLKAAHARFVLSLPKKQAGAAMSIWDLCQHYLAHIERSKGAATTLESRADTLFDFCTGYGRKWRKCKAKPAARDRIHVNRSRFLGKAA